MLIKQFTELRRTEIWGLAENEDIIITRKGSNEQRVLINFKTYESMKKALFRLQQQVSLASATDDMDWSPYLQDFEDIFDSGNFKDVDNNHFVNLARRMKVGEKD